MSSQPFPHLLVPTDFRLAARRARQRALELASHETRVTLLHVAPDRTTHLKSGFDAFEHLHNVLRTPPAEGSYVPGFPAPDDFTQSRVLQRLAQEVHPEWRQTVDVRVACRRGNVLEQIIQHAREEQVDAIVLGVRRARWPRLLPSLADGLLRHAPCEVILVSDATPQTPIGLFDWLRRWWRPGLAADGSWAIR